MNKSMLVLVGCVIVVCIALLLHPVFLRPRLEPFRNKSEQDIVETVYNYTGGSPWSQGDVTEWKNGLVTIHNSFYDVQKEIQDIYDIYVSVESQLEQSARKKHTHWVTMTPEQRSHAKMVENPITAYYTPLKSQSKIPLGGLKDNEGGLPFGIPQVALADPVESIQFTWSSKSDEERTFYEKSKQYATTLIHAMTRLEQHVRILEWSTNGSSVASLLPRIQSLQEQSNKQSKDLQKKREEQKKQEKQEAFTITKRTITIPVYPFSQASNVVHTSQSNLSKIRESLHRTREDVLSAKSMLKQMNDKGKATHAKLKAAVAK
jgi:hypothetical protein